MYNKEQIKSIHLEVTSKCQARCPMCPRRINGGMLNPLFELSEITLEDFKNWFDIEFISQLHSLNMCGNLGDPVVAKDTLEIYQYLRENNPSMSLSMHTNGSAKTVEWWKALAKLKVSVTFGIDGLADTHALYRISTDWNKIIQNASAFISEGGEAKWEMLVFKHNEHQVEDCKKLSTELGFSYFYEKHTSRFQDGKFHVLDDAGKTTHILYPTTRSTDMITKMKDAVVAINPVISCKVQNDMQIYVSANGNVSPCCWLDFSWILPKQDTRIDYMDRIGDLPNLHKQKLADIFGSGYFKKISDTWDDMPLQECARQCGKFDKMREQYVNRH